MKLKNKQTGEIINNNGINFVEGNHKTYNSLAELNAEWEDAPEEPEMFYWIDYDGKICEAEIGTMDRTKIKQIGNYFETKEEAEKAVEKLKAWKRLKDKGFRFVGRSIRDLTITYSFDNYDKSDIPKMNKDLDLLFGGEE